jgi:hypothetical protein
MSRLTLTPALSRERGREARFIELNGGFGSAIAG